MTDDPIRDLLADVAKPYMDLRPGYVAAPFGHIDANGGDLEAVRTWVEAHDGWVDNPSKPDMTGLRPDRAMASATPGDARRFVVRASALGL